MSYVNMLYCLFKVLWMVMWPVISWLGAVIYVVVLVVFKIHNTLDSSDWC